MKLKSKIEIIDIKKIKPNSNNPRIIKDGKYKALVKSIKELPDMLEMRPIVVNSEFMVLGGNMRLRACQEAGYKEVPIMIAKDWTPEQEKEFIIKDNLSFGEWDWEMIANEWDSKELNEWGMDVIDFDSQVNMDEFFEDDKEGDKGTFKIILEYTEDDYNKVILAFNNHSGSKEDIVAKLLGV
ncbi:ParB/Sulfiredoxin [uncultured Caudovirales phage]|uniref:ParB/Sulfiredoxin n=1 Tax=uncultured Caudovirales phage TaxID=2100421 RepID=A0A6J7XA18_9CAUD|nr:ParB/Sulfiredoxin [uncultured Caudovirales phage]